MPNLGDREFARLLDWVEGRLSEEEARAVEEQMARDDVATRAAIEWLRAFARVSEHTVIASPPSELREALVESFEAHAEGRRRPGLLERLAATLAFDSGLQPAFGLRSAGTQESQRQLIYTSEAADVALNFRPRPGGNLDLDGQILPANEQDLGASSVQLLDDESETGLTVSDELGGFAFEDVPPGEYAMLVSGQEVEILLSPVRLRP